MDEYKRMIYRELYDERSTYNYQDFIKRVVKSFPFKIELVQTDNGTKCTNAMLTDKPKSTLFKIEPERFGKSAPE